MDATPIIGTGAGAGQTAARIILDHVGKIYPDGTVAIGDLSLHLRSGELTVLIGGPGCGKSTALQMINRLIEPTKGQVLMDDADVATVSAVQLRRRIGYVVPHVGLFPHRSIRANVGTVPRLLGWKRKLIRARSDELLALVGLDPARFGPRYPHELSDAQRLRVGMARAVAADPVALLLDEPFAAVQANVRGRLQEDLLRLQDAIRTTIVFATQDIDEAVRLGDRIAVLADGGQLVQYAPPADLLTHPAADLVRDVVGADRGIRRLSLTPLREALRPLRQLEDADRLPTVPLDGSLYDALAAMLTADELHVLVEDAGKPVGTVSRSAIFESRDRRARV